MDCNNYNAFQIITSVVIKLQPLGIFQLLLPPDFSPLPAFVPTRHFQLSFHFSMMAHDTKFFLVLFFAFVFNLHAEDGS